MSMTENRFDEAICWLNEAIEYGEERHNAPYEEAIQALEEIQAYRAIGTVEDFKALKEKNEPKKIVSRGQGHEADCYCPNCNAFLGNDQDWCFNQTNHCSECGQALET